MRLIIPIVILLLASCRTSKNIQTRTDNLDSLSVLIKDSMTRVLEEQSEAYNRHIEELIKSGVTFEDCPPCMNRDSILNLLDSAGRTRFRVIEQQERIRELQNKVRINADGSIEAEGRIKSAMLAKSRTDDELRTMERRYDSLQRVADSALTRLQTSQTETVRIVKRTPWVPWGLVAVALIVLSVREYMNYRSRKRLRQITPL